MTETLNLKSMSTNPIFVLVYFGDGTIFSNRRYRPKVKAITASFLLFFDSSCSSCSSMSAALSFFPLLQRNVFPYVWIENIKDTLETNACQYIQGCNPKKLDFIL